MTLGVEQYRETFGAVREGLAGDREAAFAAFAAKGFPTNRVEAWKYTSLRPLARRRFAPARPAPAAEVPALPEGPRIVLVNGFLREDLTTVPVGRLDSAPAAADEPMMALNAAMSADGYRLAIDRGWESPIHVVHATLPDGSGPITQSRNLIAVEGAGSAHVVERHVGLGRGSYFVNGVTEVTIAAGGRLRHTKVQDERAEAHHLWFMPARLADRAELASMVITMGAALSRNQIDAALDGAGASLELDGAYFLGDRQHADHTSRIEHLVPGTASRQDYRGAVEGRSRGVFQGHIFIAPGAQRTEGRQSHRALLLSGQAEIDAKPVLEIHADDVECSHGVTIGDLDRDALFYLRARGIPEPAARGLLVRAFLGEVLGRVGDDALREELDRRVGAFVGAGA